MQAHSQETSVQAELVAVLAAVSQGQPRVLTTECARALPSGPLEQAHRSLQMGMRAWVEAQTQHPLGYVEQLYTFADKGRFASQGERVISVSYLGLTREEPLPQALEVGWQDVYRYFPWEDWREGEPALLRELIWPRLQVWALGDSEGDGSTGFDPAYSRAQRRAQRWQRACYAFGMEGAAWNEDMVLQRYELLFEAGLVPEAQRGADHAPDWGEEGPLGLPMRHDHRRILATGIARLRAKIKYRPVVYELMPPEFTLLQLQHAVEALAGRGLHKQNFRRLVEQQDLLEESGGVASGGAGRPAKLFRFKGNVLLERAIAGTKLPLARG